ncbi:hypothetical protein CEXT_430911 [Caerostris extrusa]|uniref:Uncharacterized protein n=1 Tax=Caerostris extrusa TaxID=172846 RepID=A0AAV4V2V4_CAEEX|nr:hypothetical protein CEXT_430911 [Caerostris extrusa]
MIENKEHRSNPFILQTFPRARSRVLIPTPNEKEKCSTFEKLEIPGNPGVILSRLSGANGVKRKNVYESRDPILTLLAFHPLIPPPPPESMIQEENRENSPGSRLSNFSGQPGAARDCHRNIPGNGVSG